MKAAFTAAQTRAAPELATRPVQTVASGDGAWQAAKGAGTLVRPPQRGYWKVCPRKLPQDGLPLLPAHHLVPNITCVISVNVDGLADTGELLQGKAPLWAERGKGWGAPRPGHTKCQCCRQSSS